MNWLRGLKLREVLAISFFNSTSKSDSATGTEGYTFNAANMPLTRAGNAYSSDLNGNTLSGGGRTNTWDSQNRLVQCVNGANTSSFVYGATVLFRIPDTAHVHDRTAPIPLSTN